MIASLLMYIGLGGILSASGAVCGGILLLLIRFYFDREERARRLSRIREIGFLPAIKQLLFEVREPELDLPPR